MKAAQREIPLAQPVIDEREIELVTEVLRSGRLSLGPSCWGNGVTDGVGHCASGRGVDSSCADTSNILLSTGSGLGV